MLCKVYVWGIGRFTATYIDDFIDEAHVAGYIDTYSNKGTYRDKKVYRPHEMKEKDYDAILVTPCETEEIEKECIREGIDISKLIYLHHNFLLKDKNKDYTFVEKIIGHKAAQRLQSQCKLITPPPPTSWSADDQDDCVDAFSNVQKKLFSTISEYDFVRLKSLELVVKEIKKRNLSGSVAELGVFRGEFAQYIHYAFSDRKCYLFDTFQGFDVDEAKREMAVGNINDDLYTLFQDTSVDNVLKKMVKPDNIVIKKGVFPQSLEGLEDEFVFVSLDVDLEDSIFEGLKYFYPRLVHGGYIFVHDYTSRCLGVEVAVDKYEKAMKCILPKVPLLDVNGTLVITK
ncbi:TylF/MycF/NovP-related O-methyltransferase [Anaerovibrio sp. RM50]|uniref:TylF/MycF/NovP-related O-methyltransferase n=1 Tax=Anaerovibrio sp. RM50 TaxID=1200557 RepID=UPI000686A900|nr:TylF/MycF/NovP-related O-methyltransferase [Anaerovibrio sp. RM50]